MVEARGDTGVIDLTLTWQRAVAGKAGPMIAVVPGNQANMIRTMCGFIPVERYGPREPISKGEIGSVENVRWVVCSDEPVFIQPRE